MLPKTLPTPRHVIRRYIQPIGKSQVGTDPIPIKTERQKNRPRQRQLFFPAKRFEQEKINQNWEGAASVVAVIDTGVDSGHQEFNNPKVDFGNSPADALNDDPAIRPSGHGTQVAGIIGANNVLGSGGTLSPASPQMNGILSGALPTNLYGLEMRRFESFIKTDRITVYCE